MSRAPGRGPPTAPTSPGLSNNVRHEVTDWLRCVRATIVGYSKNTSAGLQRAFVCYNDGIMHDLFTKVSPAPYNWTLNSAEAVNSSGWIVGCGTKNGYSRAFVLAPYQ